MLPAWRRSERRRAGGVAAAAWRQRASSRESTSREGGPRDLGNRPGNIGGGDQPAGNIGRNGLQAAWTRLHEPLARGSGPLNRTLQRRRRQAASKRASGGGGAASCARGGRGAGAGAGTHLPIDRRKAQQTLGGYTRLNALVFVLFQRFPAIRSGPPPIGPRYFSIPSSRR